MRKIILFIISLILLCSFTTAYSMYYPYFMDINASETIYLNGDTLNYTALLNLNGINYNMAKTTNYFSSIVSSAIKEDTPFYISVINGSINYQNSSSDKSRESLLRITNNQIYGFYINHSFINHSVGDQETHLLCANLQATTPPYRHITFYAGVKNQSSGKISWSASTSTEVSNTNFQYVCNEFRQTYNLNLTNDLEYFAFSCSDCTIAKPLLLGTDTNLSYLLNTSFTMNNLQSLESSKTIYNTFNIMMTSTDVVDIPLYYYEGVLRFRSPFYVTFNLYHDGINTSLTQPYTNDFQYIFLQTDATTNSVSWMDGDWIYFNWIDKLFYNIIGMEYTSSTPAIDTTLSFWGNYNNGGATIKLYEADNYSVNLETTKSKSSIPWNYEFIYPQSTGSEYDHKILNLEIVNESTQTITIFIDEYEISSFKFMVNILKNSILIILWLALIIIVAIASKDMKATSIVAVVTFGFLLKFMGIV